ncbi:bifunctional serine/threonine-protein kinase/formylglycine-generating enzyme family protein [Allorhodopirellula solitaria]|uniref:non-specific serine/threonine protein kinase n=1 Tax=Allorhodopirellula solitaria TaxID=2527987 RepID=A0A5C5XT25_9BACT|nr:bifunctional serine/threonine-protein kinase/formylglycine-generating enzyme family protein [Allorhodopirellula solitaria]TWT66406.1 Serine/threonine-protein kinase PrkC [Allorhodopirellula solitaria]
MSDENDSTKQGDFTWSGEESARDIPLPKRISRYQVSRLIGKGGFGMVFQASDDLLARQVAIKVPRRLPSPKADASKWHAEARIAAMLDHPNIVPVYDVGSTDEFPFFVVTRLIEGIDLRERLQQRRPTVAQSVQWIIEMADALQHAHEKGLVHRDVKPSNILIEKNDRPWLTDFGLAIRDIDLDRNSERKTMVGTYCYMSPEQARGEGHLVDGRADIFALGIVLYELLLGERPFSGGSSEQLLENIVRAEPRPLRQLDRRIDAELERICMKALAQRLSDRYSSSDEFANDLQRFADSHHTPDFRSKSPVRTDNESLEVESVSEEPLVVPKGLRAFDEHDQGFFLKLVPGVRDAQGIPEVIRRLKLRMESRVPQDSFRVGLIYGASGSGKSSLVRAGLVPLLHNSVHVAYVEANAKHTESRLLRLLAPLADEPQDEISLVQMMASIRRGEAASGKKVVIILDQFEQWLHAHPIMNDAELINAIRQCDGINLQCLVLIRDDFWMAATRFFHELDIHLVQDVNSTAVDRFELRHARYVLSEFGRAYGCLPAHPATLTYEQQNFIYSIVEAVAENGKVISIHLVVLAQLLKGREWNRKTLGNFVGADGVDINFLDATFHDSIASPHHRAMEVPARAVLAELLPEVGSNIKGQMKDASQLREVSGLNQEDFDQLLESLDGELRLITPTAAILDDPARDSLTDDVDAGPSTRYYQLTHDFLVRPLRQWLTRSDQQTARGRAKLRLQELTQYWRRKQETRFLPSNWEYLRILTLTDASRRNPDEQALMTAATRFHSYHWITAAAVLLLSGIGALWTKGRVNERMIAQETKFGVERLLASDTDHILESITTLEPIRDYVAPALQAVISDPKLSDDEILAARLALIESDPSQTQPLVDKILTSDAEQINLICERLQIRLSESVSSLWQIVESAPEDDPLWLRAAFALAQLDPVNERWNEHVERLSTIVVNQGTPLVVEFAPGLANIAGYLSKPMERYFAPPHSDQVRLNSAIVLSKCLQPTHHVTLTDLLCIATPEQFEQLLPVAEMLPSNVVKALKLELEKEATPNWPSAVPPATSITQQADEIDAELRREIEHLGGIAMDSFAMCQRLPLERFAGLSERLGRYGFRPQCVRAYQNETATHVATIWVRDHLPWEFTQHQDTDNIDEIQSKMRKQELFPADVTTMVNAQDGRNTLNYGVLWTGAPAAMIDSRIYLHLTEDEHEREGWGPLADGGYVPKSNLKTRDQDGQDRYSSVRWRTAFHPQSQDAWNDAPFSYQSRNLEGWQQSDVRINPVGAFDEFDVSYSAVWWKGGRMQSKTLDRMSSQAHLHECHALASENFRPASISVVYDDRVDKLVAASVWHRPFVSNDVKDAFASRHANAAIALFRLGAPDSLWPYLDAKPDCRLRSFLIDRMAAFRTDPAAVLQQLLTETDPSRKFSLITALAQFQPEQVPETVAAQLRQKMEDWGTQDPSAAIHSICSYLCHKWDWHEIRAKIETAPSPSTIASHPMPGWSRYQDHILIAIFGPVEFPMGSPGHEPFRDHHREVPRKMIIPRSFEIGAAEVTLAQFQQYKPEARHAPDYTRNENSPMTTVNWFDAISYCRWLSEQAGIDEDQMCYPPISEMREELETVGYITLPDDFLERNGYRLPTEAEWEYCARAATTTPRHFGNADDLLPKYAWTTESSTRQSQVYFHPIKQLIPNDFGLFDTLGNVMECCESSSSWNLSKSVLVDDSVETKRWRSSLNIFRGSAVFYVPTTMRSAKREEVRMDAQHPYMGFRIARTLPPRPVAED